MKRLGALIALLFLSLTIQAQGIYVAKLTQSGTLAPTATVLENTLGGTLVWTYIEEGRFRVILAGAFTDENKIMGLREYRITENLGRWRLFWDDEQETQGDSLILETYNDSDVLCNSRLSLTEVTIKVYP